ncbi:MAG: hypothetical protein RIT81_29980 [Deltaproteobacteria bacterium]
MAKIESIRPGGTLEASFGTYPLAELLIGILRGNLSGRLDVFLHPEPRNHVLFRNGVPVSVELPDSGASLVKILIDANSLPRERGLDLLRLAEASGRSEVALIRQHKLLSPGALQAALARLARAQVVKLFDVGPAEFRFSEGVPSPDGVAFTILQPLPIVYEGLRNATHRGPIDDFLATHGRNTFVLSATYPHGIDPFEWGSDVEKVITPQDQSVSLDLLVSRGLSRETAGAAIMSAYLAGMMEVSGREPERRERPVEDPRLVDARRASAARVDASPQKDPSGLVIHRRSGAGAVPVNAAKAEPKSSAVVLQPPPVAPARPATASGPNPHDLEYTAVRDRLLQYRDQNYFQVLRVAPGTDATQLERAYRFMLRRLEDEPDDYAARVQKDFLTDVADVLRDPDRGRRYANLVAQAETAAPVDRERLAVEAEPKVERAFRAMALNHTGAATYLLSWAEKQDSTRTDVRILFAMIDYLRTPPAVRVDHTRTLEHLIDEELTKRSHDWRVRLCFGLLLAERGDERGARRNIAAAPDASHPMVRRIGALVAGDRG